MKNAECDLKSMKKMPAIWRQASHGGVFSELPSANKGFRVYAAKVEQS
jgi:hypothetical protein